MIPPNPTPWGLTVPYLNTGLSIAGRWYSSRKGPVPASVSTSLPPPVHLLFHLRVQPCLGSQPG